MRGKRIPFENVKREMESGGRVLSLPPLSYPPSRFDGLRVLGYYSAFGPASAISLGIFGYFLAKLSENILASFLAETS